MTDGAEKHPSHGNKVLGGGMTEARGETLVRHSFGVALDK